MQRAAGRPDAAHDRRPGRVRRWRQARRPGQMRRTAGPGVAGPPLFLSPSSEMSAAARLRRRLRGGGAAAGAGAASRPARPALHRHPFRGPWRRRRRCSASCRRVGGRTACCSAAAACATACYGGCSNSSCRARRWPVLTRPACQSACARRYSFGLLAVLTVDGVSGNVPSATGAAGPRLLGSLTPGSSANWARCLAWMAAQLPPPPAVGPD